VTEREPMDDDGSEVVPEPRADAPESGASGAAQAPSAARRGLPARDQAAREPGSEGDRDALALAHRVVDLAADRKASDIVLLGVGKLTTVADYFVICSGGSERQLGAIADGIVEGLKGDGIAAIGREGGANAHWVLIDFGAVVVHVMARPERDYYQLERLWSEAPLLLRVL
jgi:ribosome-associated protein